jgi:hypothetical protein
MPGIPPQNHVEALFRAGQDLRDALMAHDLSGVRLHARQMARMAALLGFSEVESAALALVEVLGPDGAIPGATYGRKVFALSDVLDDATRLIGNG